MKYFCFLLLYTMYGIFAKGGKWTSTAWSLQTNIVQWPAEIYRSKSIILPTCSFWIYNDTSVLSLLDKRIKHRHCLMHDGGYTSSGNCTFSFCELPAHYMPRKIFIGQSIQISFFVSHFQGHQAWLDVQPSSPCFLRFSVHVICIPLWVFRTFGFTCS